MQVLEKLMPLLDISFANLTLVPHLKGLTSPKSSLQDRLNGFRILCLVIRYHLRAFESEPTYKRLLQQMSYDRHWRVRKQFADFLFAFLAPIHEYRERVEFLQANTGRTKKDFAISTRAKYVKAVFKKLLSDVSIEIITDGDDQVAIEGVNILTEYYFIFRESHFEQQYKPKVDEIFKNAIENRISVSQQARLSKLQGPILHRLDSLNLLTDELVGLMYRFFCICLKEPANAPNKGELYEAEDISLDTSIKEYYLSKQLDSQMVLYNAVYNLPCFYMLLGSRVVQHAGQITEFSHEVKASNKHHRRGGSLTAKIQTGLSPPLPTQDIDSLFAKDKWRSGSNGRGSSTGRTNGAVYYGNEIEKIALGLSHPERPAKVKRALAASFHELLAHKKNTKSFKRLNLLFENFLREPLIKECEVQTVIAKNVARIV